MRLNYIGPQPDGKATLKLATAGACQEIAMLLLAIAPRAVKLPVNAFKYGANSVQAVRDAAEALKDDLCSSAWNGVLWRSLHERAQAAMIDRGQPQAVFPAATASPSEVQASAAPHPPPDAVMDDRTIAEQESRCIDVLRHLAPGQQHRPNRLPRAVWETLRDNLKPGALKSLMLRRPELFTLQEDGRHWSFTVRSVQSPGSASDSANVVAPSAAASPVAVVAPPPAARLPSQLPPPPLSTPASVPKNEARRQRWRRHLLNAGSHAEGPLGGR